MIVLKKHDWKTQLFAFAERQKAKFHGRGDWSGTRWQDEGTNLCYFMRSIILYLPFIGLMHVLAFAVPLWALVIYPVMGLGYDWWLVPAWVLGIAAVVVAIILIIVYFVTEHEKRKENMTLEQVQARREAKARSAWGLTTAYFKARKESICPLIQFDNDNREN